MKKHEPNQTRLVLIGSDRFQTEPSKVGYFFWFGLVRIFDFVGFIRTTCTPKISSLPKYFLKRGGYES
ncbi:hypothetical protein MTR_3g101360 [Medicago truncatula]|uniref:Uncharacterized protein n=1 Tax=Medicago truncatula TaxID=3880 RepID=G7J6A2_MEDTR|nr:hypothetical protein MTR_3g101360 [Medicago truncatula]